MLLKVCVICCSIGDQKIAIYRFVVGGYVRKCVELRISCRVESCCIGNRDRSRDSSASYKLSSTYHRVFSDVFIACSSPSTSLTEKIGQPLIILVSDFSVSSVSHPQSTPQLSCECFLSRKSHKKLGLGFAIALDYTSFEFQLLFVVVFAYLFLPSSIVRVCVSAIIQFLVFVYSESTQCTVCLSQPQTQPFDIK